MNPVTFTKLFSSITESTIWCESDQTRLVWITMLAMANKHGYVFGSAPGLANRARVPVEAVREALIKFQQPDPDSRTKDNEGRRIEVIDGGWRLLTYEKHRAIRDEEERRDYMKNLMRQKRAVSKVSRREPPLAQAEADSREQIAEAIVKRETVREHYSRPSLGEVTSYCEERGKGIDPQQWFDFYTSNGWKVGRNSMKDWRAAVRTWEKNKLGGNRGTSHDRNAERVARNREAIITGLGISSKVGRSEPSVQDGDGAGRNSGMAKLLRQ